MAIQKYTLAQLLSTIKIVESRIVKATKVPYIGSGTGLGEHRKADGGQKVEVVEGNIQANFQRIDTLLRNRDVMKMALVASNNSTMVDIGKSSMTIAQAVEKKQSIKFRRELVTTCMVQVSAVLKNQETKSLALRQSLEKEVTNANTSSTKLAVIEANRADMRAIHEPFLIDPLNMVEKVKEMEEEIEDFLNNVDYALSAVNALTMVEVDLL